MVLHPSQQLWACRNGILKRSVNTLFPPGILHITFACLNQQQPFLNQRKEKNDHSKYFVINLHESLGPAEIEDRDRTNDPLICNRACLRLRYGVDVKQ